jgi:hypothetical protein
MIIAAYGFILFYVAGSALVLQAAYPPYGLVSVSFTGLSCYLIYNGLYFSAISVSQDMTLRQSIRKSVSMREYEDMGFRVGEKVSVEIKKKETVEFNVLTNQHEHAHVYRPLSVLSR